ncbi:MAG: hypothetical protein GX617_12700, partial [Lentisphaerae bacterium]|nr:hypothetical protein [Lentisphaerota bacterium]
VFCLGGGQGNCAVVAAPQHVHTLYLQAWSNESIPEEISGATVKFRDEEMADMVTPQVLSGQTAAQYTIDDATHPNWLYSRSSSVTHRLVADAFEVLVRVFMRRGLRLRVEVLNDANNQPLSGARLSTRYVNNVAVLMNPPNHVDGWEHIFDFEQPFDAAEPLLLRVEADGYIPQVIQLNPADATADPDNPKNRAYMLVGDQAVKLTPLPGPELSDAAMDRSGGFLPGVNKGGGADGYDPAAVKDALTLTWSVKAKPRTHEFPAETRDGQPRLVRDDIVELWLVDQRSFAQNYYNDTPEALSVPVNGGNREPGVAYSLNQPEMGWTYLQRGVLAADRKVLYQRVLDFTPAEDGSVEVTRTLFLPDMPPGLFSPALIAVSRLGAQTYYEFDYRGDAAEKQLVGARLPPWMSMLANVFGTVANAQAQSQDAGLERFLPEGFMSPLPQFTAAISTEESYLSYDYGLSISMSEGSETPGEGLLGMAQSAMGLELEAALKAGFAGREREFSLGISGSLGKESLDPNDYCLWIADFLGVKPELDPGPKGTLGTVFSESFVADNIPHQKRVQHSLSGQTGMKLTADLTSSLNAIPVVGPVVRKLGKYVDISCEASMSGLTGLKVTREWTTTYPQRKEVGLPYVGELPARRHFLGGAEEDNAQTTFDLAFNFGVGLEASASSRAGASGSIALTGEEGWTGEPALTITSN